LRGLIPTEFGTEVELKADQVWLARYNMAKQIQKLADEEFLDRKADVSAWWKRQVVKNASNLFKHIVAGKCMAPDYIERHHTGTISAKMEDRNILRFAEVKDRDYWWYSFTKGAVLSRYDREKGYLCYLTEAVATYRALFSPKTAAALALLINSEVSNLPDVLQHWTSEKPYAGNNILDRLDPLETELSNPWMKLDLDVNIYLSKRGLAQIKRDYPLEVVLS
jgi:hypothetical protein